MIARSAWLVSVFVISAVSAASVCDLSICSCDRGTKLTCDCSLSKTQELVLKKELLDGYSFNSITIANCGHLNVTSRALAGLPLLQQINVSNITNLTLQEQAFYWRSTNANSDHQTGLQVIISNCSIPEIPSYSFQGHLQNILISSVTITRIREYAFSSFDNAEKLEFNQVNVTNVNQQAFKRFTVGFLSFINSVFRTLPPRALMDIGAHEEVRLEKMRIERIDTDAVNVHSSRNFRILQSRIGHIEKHAIQTQTHGDISIHDNAFLRLEKDAFVQLTVNRKYFKEAGNQDLIFENNTLNSVESGSLTFNTSALEPRLDWVMINQTCSCDSSPLWTNSLVIYVTEDGQSSVPISSNLIFCLNPKYTKLRDFQMSVCDVAKSSLFAKLLIGLGVVLAVAVVAAGVIFYLRNRGKRYINVPTSAGGLKLASNNKGHMLVVPEGKTYRETELHVIVEHADPIVPTEFVCQEPGNARDTQ